MTDAEKRKGDKAYQATSEEAAQRQNLRRGSYTDPKSSAKHRLHKIIAALVKARPGRIGLRAVSELQCMNFHA
jgi:hypothetical protein